MRVLSRFNAASNRSLCSEKFLDSILEACRDDGCPGQTGIVQRLVDLFLSHSFISTGAICVAGNILANDVNAVLPKTVEKFRYVFLESLKSSEDEVRVAAARSFAHSCLGDLQAELGAANAKILVKSLFQPLSFSAMEDLCAGVFGCFRHAKSRQTMIQNGVMEALEHVYPSTKKNSCTQNAIDHILSFGGSSSKSLDATAKMYEAPVPLKGSKVVRSDKQKKGSRIGKDGAFHFPTPPATAREEQAEEQETMLQPLESPVQMKPNLVSQEMLELRLDDPSVISHNESKGVTKVDGNTFADLNSGSGSEEEYMEEQVKEKQEAGSQKRASLVPPLNLSSKSKSKNPFNDTSATQEKEKNVSKNPFEDLQQQEAARKKSEDDLVRKIANTPFDAEEEEEMGQSGLTTRAEGMLDMLFKSPRAEPVTPSSTRDSLKVEYSQKLGGSETQRPETEDVAEAAPGFEFEMLDVKKGSKEADLICSKCELNLSGESARLQEGYYLHASCMKCSVCRSGNFRSFYWVRDGKLFCRKDFLREEGFVCKQCDEVVTDTMVRAMGAIWHMDHFVCSVCGAPFRNGGYYRHNNKPYCADHLAETLGMKCVSCSKPVAGGVKASGKTYHPHCFLCSACKTPLGTDGFYTIDGKPYCKSDAIAAKRARPPQCASCTKIIDQGVVISALDQKWHEDCFNCIVCNVNVSSCFYGKDGKPVCKDHREKTQEVCETCKLPLNSKREEIISALGHNFHKSCFKCAQCDNLIDETGFYNVNGEVFCKKDAQIFARKNKATK